MQNTEKLLQELVGEKGMAIAFQFKQSEDEKINFDTVAFTSQITLEEATVCIVDLILSASENYKVPYKILLSAIAQSIVLREEGK